jgi:hypothetical protein
MNLMELSVKLFVWRLGCMLFEEVRLRFSMRILWKVNSDVDFRYSRSPGKEKDYVAVLCIIKFDMRIRILIV